MENTARQNKPCVLLICSDFFSYPAIISSQIQELGFRVELMNDRATANPIYKLLLRKFSWATGMLTAGHFLRKITKLKHQKIDRILIVKGEGLSAPVMRALRLNWPEAPISLYIWDSLDNTKNSGRIAKFSDHVFTFDPSDARLHAWIYRPLFAVPSKAPGNNDNPDFRWSFIGTIHSDRAEVIEKFRLLQASKGKAFVFGFFPSQLILAFHKLRFPHMRKAPEGTWSTVAMPGKAASEIVARSRAILDIEHPSQVGLTIRSIQTLLSGKKLITTNRKIADSALFHPTRVAVIERNDPKIPDGFFDVPAQAIPKHTVYAYSQEAWAREVLGLGHLEPIGDY